MGLKKKSKVSAEFNMSSLTDIIFLLLIFFMLTSSLIVPNALNLQLPGKKSTGPPPSERPTSVKIDSKGKYFINGSNSTFKNVEKKIRDLKKKKNAVIVISPGKKTPNQYVVKVMDAAFRHGVTAKLTDPK